MNTLLLGMPGGWEWIVILAVVVLLFGSSKLPQLAKAIGQSKKAFREGIEEGEREGAPKIEKN
jgi:sec-independent protein translocase protein TatA